MAGWESLPEQQIKSIPMIQFGFLSLIELSKYSVDFLMCALSQNQWSCSHGDMEIMELWVLDSSKVKALQLEFNCQETS